MASRRHPESLRLVIGVMAAALAAASTAGQDVPAPTVEPGSSTFNVFLRSTPIGMERVEVSRLDDGWIIRSTGEIGPPLGQRSDRFEVEYDAAWRPRRLAMDGVRNDQAFSVRTTVDEGTASNRVEDEGGVATTTDEIPPTSLFLPDYFFGAYEAIGARLDGTAEGDVIPVYVAPRGRTTALVRDVRRQGLATATRRLDARIYRLAFQNADGPLDAEVWIDDDHRLLRVFFPAIRLDVARQDISLVSTRLTGVDVAGDTQQRVPATGFSLAGTLTFPVSGGAPEDGWPLVVLVPGTESTGRDEHVSGVPIHGRLAAVLADVGYAVFRYDRRGVGQSGGRPESAGLSDYAEDVRDVVRFLEERDDIDPDRIAVVGHGEGGWIGLDAAAREDRIAALALMATPSTTGAEWVLEQQRHELAMLEVATAEREERIGLQRRVNAAVLNDGPWDDIPPAVRARADTRWFETLLGFDPAEIMDDVRQPVLVLHGLRDRRVSARHGEALAGLARARDRREATVDLVMAAGVDHTMTAADDETADMATRGLADVVTSGLVDWLDRTLAVER